jgi:hypothetical protein
MTALWLATVAVPSTALAWTLFNAPKPEAPAAAPRPAPRSAMRGDFAAGGRVYAAVEAALRERGHLA